MKTSFLWFDQTLMINTCIYMHDFCQNRMKGTVWEFSRRILGLGNLFHKNVPQRSWTAKRIFFKKFEKLRGKAYICLIDRNFRRVWNSDLRFTFYIVMKSMGLFHIDIESFLTFFDIWLNFQGPKNIYFFENYFCVFRIHYRLVLP